MGCFLTYQNGHSPHDAFLNIYQCLLVDVDVHMDAHSLIFDRLGNRIDAMPITPFKCKMSLRIIGMEFDEKLIHSHLLYRVHQVRLNDATYDLPTHCAL